MSSGGRRLEYQPALDGVRAFAVVLVLVFHAGWSWLPAGYLGVSVFFTLSGFLITSLLLSERDGGTGRVALGAFYARRLRRLLPASMMVVGAIVIARMAGAFDQVSNLRAEVLGVALQIYNWVRLAGETSYGDLFAGGDVLTLSPLEHYWSLSIEEQFYWVWPVALVALCRWSRRPGSWTFAITLVAAVCAPLIAWRFGPDAAYWATPARLAEILVGASLAFLLRHYRAQGRSPATWWRYLGPPAVALLLAASMWWPSGSGPAYEGALPLVAVVSVALLASLQVPGSLSRVFGFRSAVWLGQVSYGVYLIHWPVFVVMRQRGWRLDDVWGTTVAIGLTLVLAWASYTLLERPVRHAAWPARRTFALASMGTAVLVIAAVAIPAAAPFVQPNEALLAQAEIQPSGSLAPLAPVPATPAPKVPGPTTTVATTVAQDDELLFAGPEDLPPAPSRPIRMLVLGDSTGLYIGQGLAAWSLDHPEHAQVSVRWCQGCGFIMDGRITSYEAEAFVARSVEVLAEVVPDAIEELQPDVAVLMVTVNDVANREWSPEEGPLGPTDPRFRQRMLEAYEAAATLILAQGVERIIWVIPPVPVHPWQQVEMRERSRYLVQHDVIREVAANRPDQIEVVDLDAWSELNGLAADITWRPDGVHLTEATGLQVAEDFLGPEVVRRVLGAS